MQKFGLSGYRPHFPFGQVHFQKKTRLTGQTVGAWPRGIIVGATVVRLPRCILGTSARRLPRTMLYTVCGHHFPDIIAYRLRAPALLSEFSSLTVRVEISDVRVNKLPYNRSERLKRFYFKGKTGHLFSVFLVFGSNNNNFVNYYTPNYY